MDRQRAFLFNAEKEWIFVRLARAAIERGARLVLNGDIFDLTGMTPCRVGQARLFRSGVTPLRIRALLPNEASLVQAARRGAEALRARAPNKGALVVMGHTHELDLLPNYVNLGTWIDHVTELSPDGIAHPERRIAVLEIDEGGSAALRDARTDAAIWNRPASPI